MTEIAVRWCLPVHHLRSVNGRKVHHLVQTKLLALNVKSNQGWWFPASVNLNILLWVFGSKAPTALRRNRESQIKTSSLRWDDLHSTAPLMCNAVGCLMQQPGGFHSRLFFRKDQSPRVCCHYSKSIYGLPAELFISDVYSGPDWSLR